MKAVLEVLKSRIQKGFVSLLACGGHTPCKVRRQDFPKTAISWRKKKITEENEEKLAEKGASNPDCSNHFDGNKRRLNYCATFCKGSTSPAFFRIIFPLIGIFFCCCGKLSRRIWSFWSILRSGVSPKDFCYKLHKWGF